MEPIELLKKKIKTNIIALKDQDVEGHIWWDKFLKLVRECETEEATPAHPVNQNEVRELEWRASALYYTLQRVLPYAEARLPRTLAAEIEERLKMGALPSLKQADSVPPSDNLQGWIKADVLPELHNDRYSERVLCLTTSGLMTIGLIIGGEWIYDARSSSFESYGYKVSHWTPLPKPPIKSGLQASPTKKEEGGK